MSFLQLQNHVTSSEITVKIKVQGCAYDKIEYVSVCTYLSKK